MSATAISLEVFERFASGGLSLPLYYPATSEDPPSVNHIRVDLLFGKTSPVGIRTGDMETGIIQARIYISSDVGSIPTTTAAEAVLALFPRNLKLTSCRIDTTGSIFASYWDDIWYVVPVSIDFQHIS